ncbi:hypothetical protein OS493_003321 [Desmophyllum pertusum]|uniref:RDRP C-terminal head domain-containing protein n=1 Tax=Desmophyllum pertusum TaxID=174260 RepID=A0A9X0A5Z6_9CNID|nr:hypothetical protein OS493_003321 [Desmophyllum pertusum]
MINLESLQMLISSMRITTKKVYFPVMYHISPHALRRCRLSKDREVSISSQELRPDQYPDFMMKPGKPRYNSERILGKLFRKCKSLDRAQQFSVDASQTQITPDQDMIVPGYEQYIEEAKAARSLYNTKLDGLMSLYG